MERLNQNSENQLIISSEIGTNRIKGTLMYIAFSIALLWAIFQLWVVSPFPYSITNYSLRFLVLDSTKIRYIHLLFAFLLTFISYPAFRKSRRHHLPIYDILFTIVSALTIIYFFVFYQRITENNGILFNRDIIVGCVGILLLLEAARRSLGLPLVIIAIIFLLYSYFGNHLPFIIAHKGQSISSIVTHQWFTTQSIFGIAIDVSASFVFLFVLFGALLEKAGAGEYFIQLAFSLLGHLRAGPAKAAVISSAMTGMISGSSIANVVTTGTFTIPLMKKAGFTKEQAGAIEVSSSVNGQIMPPVMGAAAFLMVEYVGISYIEILKHALIPALISYIALIYIVHLEALKNDMPMYKKPVHEKTSQPTLKHRLIYLGILCSSILILISGVYYLFTISNHLFSYAHLAKIPLAYLIITISAIYISILYYQHNYNHQQISLDELEHIPPASKIFKSGMHFFIPILVLVWCLTVKRFSPDYAAFWACGTIGFIILSQKIIISLFNKEYNQIFNNLKTGILNLITGLAKGSRNMVSIAIATATAGIIVGAITQTGVGNKIAEVISIFAGNSVLIMLILTGFISLLLGLGLPTTANYIVVSSLMVNVIVVLGQKQGLVLPLIAVHLFVFYFGILADVTPPVGLASFAASAISGGDPIKTSVQSFIYSFRTLILPFLFILNPQIILVGVSSWGVALMIFLKTTIAILIFSSAMQNYFIVKNKIWETLLMFIISISIFIPNMWMNLIVEPYREIEIHNMESEIQQIKNEGHFKMDLLDYNNYGKEEKFTVRVSIKNQELSLTQKLYDFGILLSKNNQHISVVRYNSEAAKLNIQMGQKIQKIYIYKHQSHNIYIYIPLSLIILFIFLNQKRRKRCYNKETILNISNAHN